MASPSLNHRGTGCPPAARAMSTCATSWCRTSSKLSSGYTGEREGMRTTRLASPIANPAVDGGTCRAHSEVSAVSTTRMAGSWIVQPYQPHHAAQPTLVERLETGARRRELHRRLDVEPGNRQRARRLLTRRHGYEIDNSINLNRIPARSLAVAVRRRALRTVHQGRSSPR